MRLIPCLSRAAAALLLGAACGAPRAAAQVAIGSFVSGERPMYLEIDQLADGQRFTIRFMNVPAGSTDQTLYISDRFLPAAHPDPSVTGSLGPDLLYAKTVKVGSNTYSGTWAAGQFSGPIVYVQGYVKTPGGGRLTSMVETHPKVALTQPPAPSIDFPLPLVTQEVLRFGLSGRDRRQQPVRVGVPLPRGQVFEKSGVPQLTLLGGVQEAQFTTLAKWSDGSCKWVLCEYRADVPAGQTNATVKVDRGAGNFGGSALASTSGTVTTVDTGAIRFTIDAAKQDLFQSVQAGGRDLISTSAGNRPHFWDDLDREWTWHKTAVAVRRNGPVRAEVEVDGMFTRTSSASDPDRVLVRFYLEAFQGLPSIRATVSLRDTSVQFPEHLLFRGFTYRAVLNEAGPFDVRLPLPAYGGGATQLAAGSIGQGQDAAIVSGFVKRKDYALQTDHNAGQHKGFVLRNGKDAYAIEGVCVRIGSTNFCGSASTHWFSPESDFCDPAFAEVTSSASGRGVLLGLEHASRTWPASMETGGDGRIEVGILPHKAPADAHLYPLTYASAETRSFYLVVESARAAEPFAIACDFDYPVAARAELWVYNQAGVWPWKLVSDAEVKAYQKLADIRTARPDRSDPVRTVYRFAGGTGGGNNNWGETRRFYHWLRTGHGGAYFHSLFEAYYKVDKMAWSIDDAALSDRQPVRNPSAPVTLKTHTWDGSKHTFLQAVPDWGFARGETYLLDAAKPLAETILDKRISPNVQPYGNFVPGTYGAVVNAACAVLDLGPNQQLEDWVHLILDQWVHVVFQTPNNFGVNTATLGWQAPVGTPEGSAANSDGYMITWGAGKSSDKVQYGYMSQPWTDLRLTSLAYMHYVHHLRDVDPNDALVAALLARAPDMYHYARRGIPEDHTRRTGDYYIVDVFAGDGGKSNPDPFSPPGGNMSGCSPSGYSNQSIVNLLLEFRPSETAYSYGVELNRSMSDGTYQNMTSDPVLNDFIWRYLVHYGVLQP
jgi:hypothetical protein